MRHRRRDPPIQVPTVVSYNLFLNFVVTVGSSIQILEFMNEIQDVPGAFANVLNDIEIWVE